MKTARFQENSWSRRTFLRAALSVSAAPLVIRNPFAADAPSKQLRMGCIGVGRMGTGDMNELLRQGLRENARVVAVCDVDARRAQRAKETVDAFYQKSDWPAEEARVYGDFRELLARDDIDGTLICTPDHWHAPIVVAAAEAGKDVYVEKPLSYTIAEGQAVVRAVRENQRVLQVGSQQRSTEPFRKACELARNGRIGKLQAIRVGLPEDHGTGRTEPGPIPDNLDYTFWMGPTTPAPYTEDRVHPQDGYGRPGWLQIERYCLGMITGWGSHMNDTAQWGAGKTHTGPVEIRASAEFPKRGLFDVHTRFEAEARYADGVELFMKTDDAGVRFEGSDGWIFVKRWSVDAEPKELLRESGDDYDVQLERSDNHMRNFLQCMRSRRDPVAPVDQGHRSNSVCVLAHIAMKLGRKLRWNPEIERFIDDDEADRWLSYPQREPWGV